MSKETHISLMDLLLLLWCFIYLLRELNLILIVYKYSEKISVLSFTFILISFSSEDREFENLMNFTFGSILSLSEIQ